MLKSTFRGIKYSQISAFTIHKNKKYKTSMWVNLKRCTNLQIWKQQISKTIVEKNHKNITGPKQRTSYWIFLENKNNLFKNLLETYAGILWNIFSKRANSLMLLNHKHLALVNVAVICLSFHN